MPLMPKGSSIAAHRDVGRWVRMQRRQSHPAVLEGKGGGGGGEGREAP